MKVTRDWEPAFAGLATFQKVPLALDPGDLDGADVAILGAPMDEYVTHRPGARFGPRAIRSAIDGGGPPKTWHMDLGVDAFAELAVVDHGDAEVVPGDPAASRAAVRAAVDRIVAAGAIPVVLGGDHSIAHPDVSAVASALPEGALAVIQFDTHTDTATENWGVTRAHGTPFRHLVDEGVVRGDRIVQVGLRGYWPNPEEWAWARENGVRWHRMEEVIERGIDAVTEEVLEQIAPATHLFLSVDVDVLDPAFAPGTGTPEPGGMSTRELLRSIRTLTVARGLAGMEVVEVSPPYDHSGITAMAAHRVVVDALSGPAVHRRAGRPEPERP
ncbi:MAG: agmatinase [Actinomycetota bacterium]|nr:agmatinase [Actinomycetota bacterium]